jgi:hypothetical protein
MEYVRVCNEEKINGNDGPCSAEFSKATEFHGDREEVHMKYDSMNQYANDPRGPPIVPEINRTKDDIGEYAVVNEYLRSVI